MKIHMWMVITEVYCLHFTHKQQVSDATSCHFYKLNLSLTESFETEPNRLTVNHSLSNTIRMSWLGLVTTQAGAPEGIVRRIRSSGWAEGCSSTLDASTSRQQQPSTVPHLIRWRVLALITLLHCTRHYHYAHHSDSESFTHNIEHRASAIPI